MSEAKPRPIDGPGPWQQDGESVWSHWDLWFCLVARLDHDGDLVALADVIDGEHRLSGRDDGEAKISHHLKDLADGLATARLDAAALALGPLCRASPPGRPRRRLADFGDVFAGICRPSRTSVRLKRLGASIVAPYSAKKRSSTFRREIHAVTDDTREPLRSLRSVKISRALAVLIEEKVARLERMVEDLQRHIEQEAETRQQTVRNVEHRVGKIEHEMSQRRHEAEQAHKAALRRQVTLQSVGTRGEAADANVDSSWAVELPIGRNDGYSRRRAGWRLSASVCGGSG